MLSADVAVAGGGVSGLPIASALAPQCSVVLLELPRTRSECGDTIWVVVEFVHWRQAALNSRSANRRV